MAEVAEQAVAEVDRAAWPRRAAPMPSATRGCGRSIARARLGERRRRAAPPCRERPRAPAARRRAVPLTYRSSPARAPERSSACPAGTSPNTVMQMFSGPCVVSPPTSSQPCASASANRPREKPSSKTSSTRGSASASVKAERPRAAGGQVAQVDRQRLVAEALAARRSTGSAAPRPACRARSPAACRARARAARSRRPRRARHAAPGA